jgi:hypothetical protein
MPGLTQKQPSIETVESPLLEKTEELIVDRVATTEIGVEPTEPVVDTIIATEVEVEPTEPVVASTDAEIRPTSLPNAGQISYIHDGKLWVYRVDSGKTLPIFTFLDGQEYGSQYPRARFSPDGRYLAFNLGNASWIEDFETGDTINFSPFGDFFSWTGNGAELFAIRGAMGCLAIENLEDQDLLNFDIVKLDVKNLSHSSLVANIGGGLRVMGAISPNGEWASINNCRCFSECSPYSIWHLPSLSVIAPPASVEAGNFAFSSDSQTMVFWDEQTYDYVETPLYKAATDYHGFIALFSAPNAQPVNALWSPDDNWIGFTSVHFEHELTETDRCVWIVKPDGSRLTGVECGFSDLVAWSPDSTQILFSKKESAIKQLYIYNIISGSKIAIPIQVKPYTYRFIDWGRLP